MVFSVFLKNLLSVIADLHQREPAGRCRWTRKLAVTGFQQGVHGARISSPFDTFVPVAAVTRRTVPGTGAFTSVPPAGAADIGAADFSPPHCPLPHLGTDLEKPACLREFPFQFTMNVFHVVLRTAVI